MVMTEIEQSLPPHWRGLFRTITFPVAWLFPFQVELFKAAWSSEAVGLAFFKRIFLFLPAMGVLAGLWCTMLGIYTLLFRWNRVHFVVTMQVLWWDLARCTLFFWAGMGKFVFVAFGSVWGLLRLIVEVILEVIKEIFELPFHLTGTIARNFRQPGVPWLAFLLTVGWSAMEALVFTYVLAPTFGEVLTDLVGTETHTFLGPVLFVMLFAMIAGSFACMYVLLEGFAKRDVKQIIQMLIVEFFVMFVEVVFLYRELIDALTPWIAAQTGIQMGIVPVVVFASFGWMGIRGMVWFLFARYGTPTLLALIARQRLPEEQQDKDATMRGEERWERVVSKLKKEQNWFQERAYALLEAVTLPAFQVMAATLNFCVVLFTNKPMFNLPFKSLADVGETRVLLEQLRQATEKA